MYILSTNVSKVCCITPHMLSLLISECITPTDCPDNGTNYICNANKCICPSPKVLDGYKCVGKLPSGRDELQF